MVASPPDARTPEPCGEDPWRSQLGALGSFLRAQRQLADLSLRQMAAITNVSNAYLSQVERGLHQPSLKVLRAVIEALGISGQELLAHAGFAGGAVREHRENGAGTPPGSAPARGDTDVEAAILADPRLSDAHRTALVAAYRSFTSGGT